ncbi:ankyrin repeat and SOCS box protein 3 isoform X3 [Cryptotermes secundus]|nr:ankyrin repeat and SOCS box protein 3 isoform X3 [Cryptotermes secundus]XP_033610903.1 ankyrin repeat and SOCS box protein 3 isoform X3 [Cryptotermes secundus]
MQFNELYPLSSSSLGIAAREGNENAVKIFLRSGQRVDIGDNRGWTPLHEATAANNIRCLHLLLQKGQQYVNQRTMEGETPLLLACKFQDSTELVQMLLDCGADVNLGDNENHTPLHEACRNGRLSVAKILVAAGANVNEMNYNSCTPLHCAVSSFETNATLVKYLISKGADVSIQDECGRTSLFLASELQRWNMIKHMETALCPVDTRSVDGATALMVAAQSGNLKVVEELLKRGANPDLAAHDFTMALHLAIHSGHLSVVKLLLKVTSRNAVLAHCTHPKAKTGRSLCCLAIDGEYLDVLKLLLSSDLGNYILHLPVHCDGSLLENKPHLGVLYSECSPVSFLLLTKLNDLKDDILIYLEVLLNHGFPVNVKDKQSLPPLVAVMLQPGCDHLISCCVDMLLAHGADIEYTTICKMVPDPLLAACISGNSSGVLQLLRVGSSGLPDDLLRYLITHGHLDSSPHMINMVRLLLELGVTEPALYSRLQQYFPEASSDIQIKATAAFLASLQVCSLQKLCRIAVRRLFGHLLIPAMEQLPVPHCLKNYLTYKTL